MVIAEECEENPPRSLFHYTSLSTLALILKNKSLRLNSLVNLDDPQEASLSDVPGLARHCFVSCWTDDKTESIPMWNLYAGLESGVRIEMEIDPFRRYVYTAEEIAAITGFSLENISTENPQPVFLPMEDMRRFISPAFMAGRGILKKVKYTNDKSLLEPQLVSSEEGSVSVALGHLGIYKNKYWEFQNEWRYVINALPFDTFGPPDTGEARMAKALTDACDIRVPALMSHYDLRLTDEAIGRMKIVLSPKISPGNRILAESLLEQYGLAGQLEESQLVGLL